MIHDRDRPLLIAHRGHCVAAPENTLAAFSQAAALGADLVEADVWLTRDDRLAVVHDPTLDRTTSGSGRISELSWREVRRLDAGAWFSTAFAGEPVPSLEELVALADQTGIGLCVEAKGESPQEHARVALATAELLRSSNRLTVDYLASFDHAALGATAAAIPGLRTAPDRLPERGPSSVAELAAQARAAGAAVIQHHHGDLSARLVAGMHDLGIAVWAWPATEPGDITAALSQRVDAVMGDDMRTAVDIVRRAFASC